MRFTSWIVAAAISFTAVSGQAEIADIIKEKKEKNCIAAAEMQEIAKHFTQFKELANKGEYCFDDSQTSHLLAGIMFMRKTKFADSMPKSPDDLFSGRFKDNWYDYFIGRITDFDVQAECRKGVIAFVYFFGTTMYVCPLALTSSFTALDRASVFMHEARHIDGYPHITCSRGPRAGLSGACDQKISDGGSYAVTVETYTQISKYTDLHPALRAYARAEGVRYADEAFEQGVKINRKLAFLALTNDKTFQYIDLEANKITELGKSPLLGHIMPRTNHLTLFPEDKSEGARYVFARNEGATEQSAGEFAIEYNKQTPAQRAELIDVHIATQWNVKVYKTKATFACDPRAEKFQDIELKEIPRSLIYPAGLDRGAKSVLMTSEAGKIYEIGCSDPSTPFVKDSELILDQPYVRMHKVGKDVLGLGRDGKLYVVTGSTSKPLQTPFDGRVYDLVPTQTIDFLDKN